MSLPPYRVDYLPIIDRPRIAWPDDARVAFWVAPNVEHYEYLPPLDGAAIPGPARPYPDVQGYGTATTATGSASGACWRRSTATASGPRCR